MVGAPASGKSTTTREVARLLREQRGVPTTVIPMYICSYFTEECWGSCLLIMPSPHPTVIIDSPTPLELARAVCRDGYHYYKHELDAMADPAALHARRGAHWTFNAERFVKDLTQARALGAGRFPSFDHHVGDPLEDAIEVSRMIG